ncbi:gastrula zinc finger protein XlCGF17.1-like isoform X2 [Cryptotermes secundus]|uniref:gastrula zinc finger protein XlCGF17.1-like isoform X2 n=1 Tax=Cryptotermes secundus TaxID=105785 RepID=UPI001454DFDC|nr:gastrula zinc finger protein XlCGF17.1-like isoform X2 [Cryptotermes secundus]
MNYPPSAITCGAKGQIVVCAGFVCGGFQMVQHVDARIPQKEEPTMEEIKTEPNSDSETFPSPPLNEELPVAVMKTEANEESWDVATMKNESDHEVITGDCGMLLERVEQLNRERENCISDGDIIRSSSNIDLIKRSCNEIEESYVCDICKKHFTQNIYLVAHQLTHRRESLYSCSTCIESVSDNCDFPLPQQIHAGKNEFSCDVCCKTFAQRVYLVKHKRIHTGEKPYMCKICNKRFAQSGSLTTHKRTHTGERPYKCNMCNKGFVDNAALSKHRRVHTGEKPFICEICNKSFSQRSCLVKHRHRAHWEKTLQFQ